MCTIFKYILSGTYFCRNSIKLKIKQSTKNVIKKKELNLNLGEPSEVKSLAFHVRLC